MSSVRTRRLRTVAITVPAMLALAYGAHRLYAGPGPKAVERATVGPIGKGTYLVPTGQIIEPVGKNLQFDGRPLDMALRPDGKLMAVMLLGETKLLDTATGEFLPVSLKQSHNFGGIAWSKDGTTLYSTGSGRSTSIYVTQIDGTGKATASKPIAIPLDSRIGPNGQAKSSAPCSLALSPDGKTLYAALFNNASVAAIDLTTYNPETGEVKFTETPVGSSPDKVAVSPDGAHVYVSNRGGKVPDADDTKDFADPVVVDPETYKASTATVSVLNTAALSSDPEHAVAATINVGLAPADMTISANGKYLYTANANAETVSVISTVTNTVCETIPVSPAPGKLAAACPNGLALSPDGASLYVSLGGDNAIEVIKLGAGAGGAATSTSIAGLIPTAWFPLCVKTGMDGKTLFVGNSKGFGSIGPIVDRPRANNGVMTPEMGPGGVVDGGNFVGKSVYAIKGSIGVIGVPDAKMLAQYTAQVARNAHFDRMNAALTTAPDPFWSRFKHVILLIKENRTYDQIFGDIPLPSGHVGGDPKLVMFGEKITPNQHALAKEFGVFDNIYCSGTISADGHHWVNEAFASDYSERMMNVYPRSYPCCGTDPLVYAGNPFLWQAAMQAGKSFYNYGEFNPLPSIQRHGDKGYNSKFEVTADRNEDVAHCERILADLTGAVKGDGKDAHPGLADLTTIWFPNNHTSGTRPGSYSPESDVADNDLAVGRLVSFITNSKKYWQDEPTAIFIIEDDAQGGLDHIDGHRTCGMVISPFNRRHQVFSTNYNQLNILRTIELILGLKPLNQFDAAAAPMRPVFQDKADYTPFNFLKNRVALNIKNPPINKTTKLERKSAEISATLDFSEADRADPDKLTEVLWHHTHPTEAYPPADASY
jgi:YVTN family beta-propeller protein